MLRLKPQLSVFQYFTKSLNYPAAVITLIPPWDCACVLQADGFPFISARYEHIFNYMFSSPKLHRATSRSTMRNVKGVSQTNRGSSPARHLSGALLASLSFGASSPGKLLISAKKPKTKQNKKNKKRKECLSVCNLVLSRWRKVDLPKLAISLWTQWSVREELVENEPYWRWPQASVNITTAHFCKPLVHHDVNDMFEFNVSSHFQVSFHVVSTEVDLWLCLGTKNTKG